MFKIAISPIFALNACLDKTIEEFSSKENNARENIERVLKFMKLGKVQKTSKYMSWE